MRKQRRKMRKFYFLALMVFAASAGFSQIDFTAIDTNYNPRTVIIPGNPAGFQILFTGGVDVVKNHNDEYSLAKEWHDFLGYVEKDGKTYLICNHERIIGSDVLGDGGGMTVWEIKQNTDGTWDRVGDFKNVDFSAVGGTLANCGGMQAPNGRIWTAEEWMQRSNAGIYGDDCDPGISDTSDYTITSDITLANGATVKKYQNFNWMVEVDPIGAKAIRKQYNMGRFGHEGGAMTKDLKTVYLTDDSSPGGFYKFEADNANDFNTGQLYAYKQEAGKYTGSWIALPMDNIDSLVNVQSIAARMGATMFMRGEWIEVSKNGKVYWTETGRDDAGARLSRYPGQTSQHHIDRGFTDDTYNDFYGRVMEFDPADNSMKVFLEAGEGATANDGLHLSNPDGLTFLNIAGKEFMVIQEDLNGTSEGRNPDHALGVVCEMFLLDMGISSPDVDNLKRIAVGTMGAEVTGARASADGGTLFFNVQHPYRSMSTSIDESVKLRKSYENTAMGIGYKVYPYNHSMTVAITNLDKFVWTSFQEPVFEEEGFSIYPNPATRFLHLPVASDVSVYDMDGQLVKQVKNTKQVDIADLPAGAYMIQNAAGASAKFIVE